MRINCLHCKKKPSSRKETKYCSRECYLKSKLPKYINKHCEQCHKIFQCNINSKKSKNKKFCNKTCRFNSRIKNIEYQCLQCDSLFVTKKWQKKRSTNIYCSTICYLKFKEAKNIIRCTECNKEFEAFLSRQKYYQKLYCSNKCRLKNNTFWLIGNKSKFNNNYDKFTRSLRSIAKYLLWKQECIKRDGHKCVKCSRNSQLTVHHIVTMGDFIKKYGFNKDHIVADPLFFDINNGTTLCRSCHLKEHLEQKENKDV